MEATPMKAIPLPAEWLAFDQIDSPIGVLSIAADPHALRHIEFAENRHPAARAHWRQVPAASHAVLALAQAQLRQYFAGQRRQFELPLAPRGTPFQVQVWRSLGQIPYGETCSYRDLASRLGRARATRAVGAANGRNPLPIVLPCHRVIGQDGSLTGFGGGLTMKAALLALEREASGFALRA